MSEQKPCLLDEQRKARPKIEDAIPEYMDGTMKAAALDFIAWLRANKMSPGWAGFTKFGIALRVKTSPFAAKECLTSAGTETGSIFGSTTLTIRR